MPGLIYVFVTVLVALGAFNSQNNLLFWAFGFSLSMLIISGILSGAMLMGVDVQRIGVDQPRAGEPATITYRVRNRNRFVPVFALLIAEVDATPRSRLARFLSGGFRASRSRPAPSQSPPNPGWSDLLTAPVAFVGHVGPGHTAIARAGVLAQSRGVGRLRHILVSSSFPFGIMRKSLLFEQPEVFTVHPARQNVDPAVLRNSLRLGDRGATPTRRPGPGAEFFALRDYRPGDGIRAVAWRASARRGELLVRQPAAPAPLRIVVWLDLSPDSTLPDTERAISIAGSLLDLACERRLEVGIAVPAAGLYIAPREGRLHRARLLDELAGIDAGALDVSPVAAHAPLGLAARAAVVVVHSAAEPNAPLAGAPAGATFVSAHRDPSSRPENLQEASAASAEPSRAPRGRAAPADAGLERGAPAP
ncbi:MAG: DUF58 domain-containing protein [Phycisphaerales bacterium]